MFGKFLLKNKRGSQGTELSLIHLLEIIIGIAIVVLLLYVGAKLIGLFIGKQEYDSAINNMEALSVRIKELVKEKKNLDTQTMLYSIPNGYILVGFSYDDKGIVRTDCTEEDILNSRPSLCESVSCLCIYENFGNAFDWSGKDFDSKGEVTPLKCRPFEDKIVFLAPSDSNFRGAKSAWRPNHYNSPDYHYVVLYGECGGPWNKDWGVKQIYIEKYHEGDINYIFIGGMYDANTVKRSEEIKSRIK